MSNLGICILNDHFNMLFTSTPFGKQFPATRRSSRRSSIQTIHLISILSDWCADISPNSLLASHTRGASWATVRDKNCNRIRPETEIMRMRQ